MNEVFGWNNSEMLNQHDIQEAIRVIFGYIEDALKNTPEAERFSEILKGKISNTITCESCKNQSTQSQDYFDLYLNLKNKKGGLNHTLVEALKESLQTEPLELENAYFCSYCDQKQKAHKTTSIESLPEYVCFYLNRFEFDQVTFERKKIKCDFDFPFSLDFSAFPEIKNDQVYEFFSGIIHKGSAYAGHYHIVIRDLAANSSDNIQSPVYNNLNDAVIRTLNEVEMKSFNKKGDENFYMYIYRRQSPFKKETIDLQKSDIFKEIEKENLELDGLRKEYIRKSNCICVQVMRLTDLIETGKVSADDLQTIEEKIDFSSIQKFEIDRYNPGNFIKNIKKTFDLKENQRLFYVTFVFNDSKLYYVEAIDLTTYDFLNSKTLCMNSLLLVIDEVFLEFTVFQNFCPFNVA